VVAGEFGMRSPLESPMIMYAVHTSQYSNTRRQMIVDNFSTRKINSKAVFN
jgi:hypothetical protein